MALRPLGNELDCNVNDEVQDSADDQQPEASEERSAQLSLGQRLRAERERQGITLDDVMLDTRMPSQHIESIEKDQYDKLPSEGYLKGYIRNYSRYLKLDPDEMLESLGDTGTHEEELVQADVGRNRAAARFFRDFQGVGTIIGIAIFSLVILCGAFAIWWFGFYSPRDGGSSSDSSEQSNHTELESASQSSALSQDNGSAQPVSVDNPTQPDNGPITFTATAELDPSLSNQPNSDDTQFSNESIDLGTNGELSVVSSDSYSPAETTQNSEVSTDRDISQTSGDLENSDGSIGNTLVFEGAESEEEADPVPEHDLVFTFIDDDSYLAVTDSTNSELVRGVQEEGTELTLDGEAPFRINIGNVTAVRMLYQGEEVALDQYTDRASTTASFDFPP